MWQKAYAIFDQVLTPTKDGSRAGLFWLFVAGASSATIVFILAGVLAYFDEAPGTFGDFVGGVLNPILTFLTFMGLILTIVLQQTELAESRVELAKSATALEGQLRALDRQNFEATFFQMLNLHNTIVNAMDVHRRNQDTLRGRDCFRHFVKELRGFYDNNPLPDELDRIVKAHEQFWEQFHGDLAHYYRYLYNIIRFIDETKVDKSRYMRVLRAQLSDDELFVLFYNGVTHRAVKFKAYVEKFALFDNLPDERLMSINHKTFYKEGAFKEDVVAPDAGRPKEPHEVADHA